MEERTKNWLVEEIEKLRQRVSELELLSAKLKQTEEELRQSEERYRTLFENAPDVIYSVSTEDGTIRSLNPAFERFLGWSREEWIGRPFIEIIHPDDWGLAMETYDPVLHGRTPPIYELRVLSKSGEYLVGEFTSMPKFRDGRVVEEFGIVRDVTERKKVEAALAAERENLAVTLRSIGDGVITADTEGRVVLINKVAEELTGWTAGSAIGKPLEEVFYVIDEKTRQRHKSPVKEVLEAGEAVEIDSHTVLISKDGIERIVSYRSAPVYDREGKVMGIVSVFRDITEKRRIEEELSKADKLESVGILAGGIAHDFNNILFGILGNVSLAKRSVDPKDKVFKRLEMIEEASLRAKDLTQQLLTFSKGGAPIIKTADIVELLKESANFALRGSDVRCEFSISDDLWPVEVDEGQMSQVINNIVINADQAMPSGGVVKIRAKNVTSDKEGLPSLKPGKYVKISVEDQGVGIPEENLRKIFDPYFTTKERGSGLGLAVSYSIVKNHGGYIAVESRVGVGTTFHIYIPASPDKVPEAKRTRKKVIPGKGRVLVMDDEDMVRKLACDMLNDIGYEAVPAKDGFSAIELYKEFKGSGHPFDAVIMDITIPGSMGGKEAVRKLIEFDPSAKVIVSSGYSNDPIMAEFKKYGFSAVIAKPFTLEELSETLHKLTSKNGSGTA